VKNPSSAKKRTNFFILSAQEHAQKAKIPTIAPLRFKNSEPKIFSVRTGEI
jgi:hypothetical protein